jgi:hypothetical protein
MSDTPETDEHIWVYAEYDNRKLVDAEFARNLERERDMLKKHISIMDISHKIANDEYFKLAVENEKLERERDEARFDLEFRRELYAVQELQLSNTIRPKEEAAGLLDKANIALRVKWVNALRAIVGLTMPKNKSGVSLVSDIDLILASDEQRLQALEKIK